MHSHQFAGGFDAEATQAFVALSASLQAMHDPALAAGSELNMSGVK